MKSPLRTRSEAKLTRRRLLLVTGAFACLLTPSPALHAAAAPLRATSVDVLPIATSPIDEPSAKTALVELYSRVPSADFSIALGPSATVHNSLELMVSTQLLSSFVTRHMSSCFGSTTTMRERLDRALKKEGLSREELRKALVSTNLGRYIDALHRGGCTEGAGIREGAGASNANLDGNGDGDGDGDGDGVGIGIGPVRGTCLMEQYISLPQPTRNQLGDAMRQYIQRSSNFEHFKSLCHVFESVLNFPSATTTISTPKQETEEGEEDETGEDLSPRSGEILPGRSRDFCASLLNALRAANVASGFAERDSRTESRRGTGSEGSQIEIASEADKTLVKEAMVRIKASQRPRFIAMLPELCPAALPLSERQPRHKRTALEASVSDPTAAAAAVESPGASGASLSQETAMLKLMMLFPSALSLRIRENLKREWYNSPNHKWEAITPLLVLVHSVVNTHLAAE